MKKILLLLICVFLLYGCYSENKLCSNGHTFDKGSIATSKDNKDIVVFKCIHCDAVIEKIVEYNEEYISFDNIYSKIHVDAKTSKNSTGLKIITTPMVTSDCKKGKHQWVNGDKQNINEISYEIDFSCSNCDKEYVETHYNSPKYFHDVFDTSVLTRKYFMSNYSAINSSSFNEQQAIRFEEILQLTKNCEIYKTTYYDYKSKFKIGMHYNKNNIGGNYYLTCYNDFLVLELNQDKYVVKDNGQFNKEILNEFFEYFFITENNIINEEYDFISDTRLEYIYKNSNKVFNDFGFTELRDKNISVFNINIPSKDYLEDELNKKFSSERYSDYSIKEINESDYFYYASVDYSYNPGSTYNTYFVAFKKKVFDIENEIIYTRDKEIIKNIFDTLQYSSILQIRGFNLVHSEIEEFEDHFRYTKYDLQSSGGDWDVPDSVYFVRSIYEISKKTGEIKLVNESSINLIAVSNNYTSYGIEVQDNFIPHPVCFDITKKIETEMFSNFNQYINELKYEDDMSTMYIDSISSYEAMKYVGFNYYMYYQDYDFVFFIHKKESKENVEVDYSVFKNMIFYNGNIYITKINAERANYTSIYNEGDIIVQLVLIPKKWSEKLNENSQIIINEYIEK